MNEQDIRAIVDDEIKKKLFQLPKIPPHTHNGVDNIKIPKSSVIPNVASYGAIFFAGNKTYTLNFASGGPSLILLNGLAFQTGPGDDYVMIDGNAVIPKTMAFQPNNTSSVIVGGTPYPITNKNGKGILGQCSTNLYIAPGSGGTAFGHVDDNFIVNAFSDTGVHVVTGQLLNIQPSSVDFVVTNLASGWELVANFTII